MGCPPIWHRQTLLCSEFAAVLGSLFAYFFYMVTAFTALTGLMLITFGGDSTLGKVLRYPHPIVERTIAATNSHHPLFMLATKQESTAKESTARDTPAENINASSAKADAEKVKHERLAHLHKLASQRRTYEGQGYSVALRNAAGYRPGLDSQR